MQSEYFTVPNKKQTRNKVAIGMKERKEKIEVNQISLRKKNMRFQKLTERALLLLSFKEANTQNLRYIMKLLGIRTIENKRRVIQEIFRLIREGIVYVPKGLPQLIDQGIENIENVQSIDLCLLKPYDILIQEIQDEIEQLRKQVKNRTRIEELEVHDG